MKNMKRLICLLLVLVSIAMMLPVFAAADSDDDTITVTIRKTFPSQKTKKEKVTVGDDPVKLEHARYVTINKTVYEFSHYEVSDETYQTLTIPRYTGTKAWEKKWKDTIEVVYKRHTHEYKKSHNRIYHWDTCECGTVGIKEPHVDPLTVTDKTCPCGYVFKSNANLTTLWLANMALSPAFQPETTDYIGELVTYRDVTSTSVSTRTFDALAVVEKPTDLTIGEGLNKFQVTVTAEDKVTKKTYTVTVVKPVVVEDIRIAADGEKIAITPKVSHKRDTAYIALPEQAQEKLVEMIAEETASQLVFLPQGSKWASFFTEVTLTANVLKALADKGGMDLVIQVPYGAVLTVPAAEIPALAEKESITFRLGRSNDGFLLLEGDMYMTYTGNITLTIPE